MKPVPLIVLVVTSSITMAHGQTTGACAPAQAEAYLDIGNVRARILNDGALFWRGSPAVYEIPKDGGAGGIFTTTLWLGGIVNGEPRVSAARYGSYEMWPGPLDAHGNPPSDCEPFDRIYSISGMALERYEHSGQVEPELLQWPVHLGAPVLDGDGIPHNYNVAAGDRPELLGDQMLWWVMNDVGNEHLKTKSKPIGMEVHGTAFAYNTVGTVGNSTFYHYKLIYRGQAPLEDAYFGLHVDPDLGNFDDDYVGSDSMLSLGYVYNADNNDEGMWGYGENPPALGFTILQGPYAPLDNRDNDRDGAVDEDGERQPMSSFLYFISAGGCTLCQPSLAQEYYHFLQGRWRLGEPITYGGDGYNSSDRTTTYMYSGDPTTRSFWSEFNLTNQGYANTPADRRFVMATGPFTMQPGDTEEITFAIVWARGGDHLDSIRKLKDHTAYIHTIADDLYTPNPVTASAKPAVPTPAYPLSFSDNYPNPFADETTIRYSLPIAASVHLAVYDALGQEVAVLVNEEQSPDSYTTTFAAETLPPGVYFYRLTVNGHYTFTKAMLRVR